MLIIYLPVNNSCFLEGWERQYSKQRTVWGSCTMCYNVVFFFFISVKALYELKPIPKRRSSAPHKRSPKQSRHKEENSKYCDSKQTMTGEHTCSDNSCICDKTSNSLTKEQISSDLQSRTVALHQRSDVKDTPEQKQQTESKGRLHGISFKPKSSSGKTDFPGKAELSLRSSFNSKKHNICKEGSSVKESRSKDSTPESSPQLTQPLKFVPGSLEHTNVTRYSSYDSTKFNVPSPDNSDDDEIMVWQLVPLVTM